MSLNNRGECITSAPPKEDIISVTHRRSTIVRPRTPLTGWQFHLAEAARLWIEAEQYQSTSDYCTTGNEFLVAAERTWIAARPEVLDTRSAIQIWRDVNRYSVTGEHHVYYLWRRDECLYVGVTSRLFSRLRHHETRFGQMTDRVQVIPFNTRLEAERWESAEILRLQPTHNITGKIVV